MQFFYIDYMNADRKERNVGFLRVERSGICIGLRGVPLQCGNKCSVYAVGDHGEKWCLGEVGIQNGYGMEKLAWGDVEGFEKCVRVEVPFYGYRKGVCVLRESAVAQTTSYEQPMPQYVEKALQKASEERKEDKEFYEAGGVNCDLPDKLPQDKWEQLVDTYPRIHIFPEAQSLLIRPKDLVVLTQRYHSLISNSFVLHSYYNYRQLLLLRFEEQQLVNSKLKAANERSSSVEYYLGVPGVYYEREKRIAQMFGFEGFDIGEARMREEEKREIYEGCFGYYMKQVEI